MQEQENLVMPGDRLGLEEEFVPAENTFVDDDGNIRSSIIGNILIDSGKISVHNPRNEIKIIERGMSVIGTVTDDLRTVMFVKIDSMRVRGKEYFAIKDGKLIAPKPPRAMGRYGDRERDGRSDSQRERPQPQTQEKSKQANVGDVILATIIDDASDTYVLGIRDKEFGVIYSLCEICNTHLKYESDVNALVCPECKHKQVRKVSIYYNKPEAIKRLFE